MSPRAALLLAAPFALLAFALRLGATLWAQPLTWNLGTAAGLTAFLALVAVTAGVPLGAYALLTRSRRPQRATGIRVICLSWAVGQLIPTERVPGQDAMRIAHLGGMTTVFAVIAAALLTAALVQLVTAARHLSPPEPPPH